jgi:recombination protein RecR
MFPKTFQKLIEHFTNLPSVGPKMAERLVLHLFKQDKSQVEAFANDLEELVNNLNFCRDCHHIAEEGGKCVICSAKNRDRKTICVAEDPLDIISIEKTNAYKGLYYVLGGSLSVMSEEEIKKLNFAHLIERVKEESVEEVIIATNPTTDGDTTALYLVRLLKDLNVKITRLGRGMPTGGDIEYADEVTISSALEGRKEM